MALTEPTKVDRLVAELRDGCSLTEVDAHRAAFLALALADGWPKARIGRYLGVSRARVGQKADKLQDYVLLDQRGEVCPTLGRVLAVADSARQRRGSASMVEFLPDDWEDLDFARRLCDMVAL